MAIQSMTGFGRAELEGEGFNLTVEIKTVNNRYKDFRFKMGSVFYAHEINLKKQLEKKFQRGSFDIFINYKKNQKNRDGLDLDEQKVMDYLQRIKALSEQNNFQVVVQPTEFMRSDFYVADEDKEEELVALLNKCFPAALEQLELSRTEEGAKLVEKLLAHKALYQQYFEQVCELRNSYQDQVKAKLLKRFADVDKDLPVDEPRFLQEIIYYMEKLDIDEEINRIQIHLEKLSSLLESQKEVGRQIDFLMQELNRETNTIGSKSGHREISEHVVQMKVQLEKIREQALNLQ